MKKMINVLIVEDELLIAWDIKFILEQSNYYAFIVKDYNSAIDKIKLKTPDIVLIDVYLGNGRNGIDLGVFLKDGYNIPFIYLTSYSDKETIDKMILTKPNGFIAKPFKKVDLVTSIQIILNTNQNKDNYKSDSIDRTDIPNHIKVILCFIDKNIESKINIDDLVKLTKWSKHHFIRIFTSEMGVSPYCYILSVKIDYAKKLILENDDKLENIAYDLGFQSYVNFARTFKKFTKLSPKEFRRLN